MKKEEKQYLSSLFNTLHKELAADYIQLLKIDSVLIEKKAKEFIMMMDAKWVNKNLYKIYKYQWNKLEDEHDEIRKIAGKFQSALNCEFINSEHYQKSINNIKFVNFLCLELVADYLNEEEKEMLYNAFSEEDKDAIKIYNKQRKKEAEGIKTKFFDCLDAIETMNLEEKVYENCTYGKQYNVFLKKLGHVVLLLEDYKIDGLNEENFQSQNDITNENIKVDNIIEFILTYYNITNKDALLIRDLIIKNASYKKFIEEKDNFNNMLFVGNFTLESKLEVPKVLNAIIKRKEEEMKIITDKYNPTKAFDAEKEWILNSAFEIYNEEDCYKKLIENEKANTRTL